MRVIQVIGHNGARYTMHHDVYTYNFRICVQAMCMEVEL